MVTHEFEHQIQVQMNGQKLLVSILAHAGLQLEFNHVELAFEVGFADGPHLVAHPDMSAYQLRSLEFGHDANLVLLVVRGAGNRVEQVGVVFRRLLVERRKQAFLHHRRRVDVHVQEL